MLSKRHDSHPFDHPETGRLFKASGFTLVEVLVAMSISLVVIMALYSAFTLQYKHINVQEQVAEMQQSARVAMDRMIKDIRMAGYNPTRASTSPAIGIINAAADSIQFTLDVTNAAGTGIPEGDTLDMNENITFGIFTAGDIQRLGRKATAGGNYQTMAEHIQSVLFTYYDGNGNIFAAPVSTPSQIRRIKVGLTARTAKQDPVYGYRTFTLESFVTPRNVGL